MKIKSRPSRRVLLDWHDHADTDVKMLMIAKEWMLQDYESH